MGEACTANNMTIFYIVVVAALICGAIVLLALSINFFNKEVDNPPAKGTVSKGDIFMLCALGAIVLMFGFITLQGGNTEGGCASVFLMMFYVVFVVGIVGIIVLCMTYGVVFMRDSSNSRRQDRGQFLLTASLVLLVVLIAVVAYQASFKDLLG